MCNLCVNFREFCFFALDGVCFKNKNDIIKINLISDFCFCIMFVLFK